MTFLRKARRPIKSTTGVAGSNASGAPKEVDCTVPREICATDAPRSWARGGGRKSMERRRSGRRRLCAADHAELGSATLWLASAAARRWPFERFTECLRTERAHAGHLGRGPCGRTLVVVVVLLTDWNCARDFAPSQRHALEDGRIEQRRPAAASNLLSVLVWGGFCARRLRAARIRVVAVLFVRPSSTLSSRPLLSSARATVVGPLCLSPVLQRLFISPALIHVPTDAGPSCYFFNRAWSFAGSPMKRKRF